MPAQKLSGKHTYDVSMKARPEGHIAITCKVYKVAEAHPTTTTKNKRFVIIVPLGKTSRFMYISKGSLPKAGFSTVHFPTDVHLL